jgi:hypothetical protein
MLNPYINTRELARTLNLYSNQKSLLVDKLKEFVNHKMQHPYNGGISNEKPGFGGSDKKFRSDGNFGTRIRNVAHAHLTDDISVAYLIDGDRLNIYGVYTHDALGTGQPANINRQKQVATRWSNLDLDAPFTAAETDVEKKDKASPTKAPAGAKPDFTPKAKVAQQAAQPAANPVVALAKQVDAHWPQRGLLNKLSGAQTKQQAVSIISSEAQNIMGLKQRGAKLYPNQMDYFKGLDALYQHYSK